MRRLLLLAILLLLNSYTFAEENDYTILNNYIEKKEFRKALEFVSQDKTKFTGINKYYGNKIINYHLRWFKRKKHKIKKVEPQKINGRNFLLGYLYWLNKEFDLAEEYFKASLKDSLDLNDYVYSFISSCKRKKDDFEGIVKWNNKLIDLYNKQQCTYCNKKIISEALFENAENEIHNENCIRGIKLIDTFLSLKESDEKYPLALYLKAGCLKKKKKEKEALELYKKIWKNFYNSEISKMAFKSIKELNYKPELSEKIRHIKNMAEITGYEYALIDLHKLKNTLVKNPFNFVKDKDEFNSVLNKVNYEIGYCNYILRNFDIARDIFRELTLKGYRNEDTLYYLALSYRKLGDYESSYLVLSNLRATYPKSRNSAYYSYLMGLSRIEVEDFISAKKELGIILDKYKHSKYYDDAYWTIGFGHYLRGELKESIKYFSEYHENIHDEFFSYGKGLYWMARSYMKLGEKEKAIKYYSELVEKYPFSYYTWMFFSRFKHNKDVFEKVNNLLPERSIVSSDCSITDYGFEKSLRNIEYYYRGNILNTLGLKKSAVKEFNMLFIKNVRRRRNLKNIAKLLYNSEDYFKASYIIAIYYKVNEMIKSIKEHQPEFTMLYPKAHFKWFDKFSKEYKVPGYMGLAVMKSESFFRHTIRSSVGAIGLMQLMPSTARKVSSIIGFGSIDENMLTDPQVNIRLGTYYLRKLLSEFNENIPLVVASYNAGPHKVTSWIKKSNTQEMDEFIELIPYFETRKYTKKVLAYYGIYKYLYENKEILVLNTRITDDLQMGPFPLKEIWHSNK